jgi:hypothetical protein
MWSHVSDTLDGLAAPRRRLRRVSSVVDWPAEAGRDRRAGGKIPHEVCAEQHEQLSTIPAQRDAVASVRGGGGSRHDLGRPPRYGVHLCAPVFERGALPPEPQPIPRPLPTTGPEADIRDVEDPEVGDDADTCPYQQPERQMRDPHVAQGDQDGRGLAPAAVAPGSCTPGPLPSM